MHTFLFIIVAAAAGGIATSIVEYRLNYNLVDKFLDLFKKLP